MYAFVDRHPSRLDNAGRFLLWAMRGWSVAMAKSSCPLQLLHRPFNGMGAAEALPHLHIAMTVLHRDARDRPRMGQMGCCRIHEDEAVLLSLWHAVAHGNATLAEGTLKHLVKEEAVRPVLRAMTACSTQLVIAGFDLTADAAKIEERP